MLGLTPLNETRAGQELIAEGMEEGVMIGRQQTLRQVLGKPELTEQELSALTPTRLKAQVARLQKQLQPPQRPTACF